MSSPHGNHGTTQLTLPLSLAEQKELDEFLKENLSNGQI